MTLQIPNAKAPSPGLLVGGQPTAEHLAHLADQGFELIIDLRGQEEERGMDEKSTVEALGLQYMALPIPDRASLNWNTAAELDALLESTEGKVLVHCRSGNRVGSLFALRAALSPEVSMEEALAIGRVHGMTSLEDHVRPLLEQGAPGTQAE